MKFGNLDIVPTRAHTELLAASTKAALGDLHDAAVFVVQIDPQFSDTAAFCQQYGVGMDQSVNCVIVEARRGENVQYAACMVLATHRADINGAVRRHLGARKISFAPMDAAVRLTGMEYGGITPIGLPPDWPILIDPAVQDIPQVLIGSGIRASKLVVPGKLLAGLPGAVILPNLVR